MADIFEGLADDWLSGEKGIHHTSVNADFSIQSALDVLSQLLLGLCFWSLNHTDTNVPHIFASAALVLFKSVCESWNVLEVKTKCWSTL